MIAALDIVRVILADVTDRRGWRQEWEQFDADTQSEIKSTWQEKVEAILEEAES
jgi:hypothetical protein